MENKNKSRQVKKHVLKLIATKGEVKLKRVISVAAHVVVSEENLPRIEEILNANPNVKVEFLSDLSVTITGKFQNDGDFVDFWCSVYSGDLGKLFADIEDISWTVEEEPEETQVETEWASVALNDTYWTGIQTLIEKHAFDSLSDLILTAINNLVKKWSGEAKK